jgi:hypothetical protein
MTSRHHASGRLRATSTRNRAARWAPSITSSGALTLPLQNPQVRHPPVRLEQPIAIRTEMPAV